MRGGTHTVYKMYFTVQLILSVQFHICVDFFSLQEIGDPDFCNLVYFIFADICKRQKMTHDLYCDGVSSAQCGMGPDIGTTKK